MSVVDDRHEADRDIEEVFGLVPEFFQRVPDYLLPSEWASFKSLVLSDQTAIHKQYKEMIGLVQHTLEDLYRLSRRRLGRRAHRLQRHPGSGHERRQLLTGRGDREHILAGTLDAHVGIVPVVARIHSVAGSYPARAPDQRM